VYFLAVFGPAGPVCSVTGTFLKLLFRPVDGGTELPVEREVEEQEHARNKGF